LRERIARADGKRKKELMNNHAEEYNRRAGKGQGGVLS